MTIGPPRGPGGHSVDTHISRISDGTPVRLHEGVYGLASWCPLPIIYSLGLMVSGRISRRHFRQA